MDEKNKKWKELQNIILEEKYLLDALFKSRNNDYADIKTLITDISEVKLKIRQLRNKNDNDKNGNDIEYDEKIEFLNDDNKLNKDIKKFLFFMRNNIDYISELIKLINNEQIEKDKIEVDSLIELILDNLYNKFPEENSKNNHLMVIIYKLLEDEISKMDCAISDDFISSNYFLDKLLKEYLLKKEPIKYLEKLLCPLVNSIEKENEERNILSLSLIEIQNDINNKFISNIQENDINLKRAKSLKVNTTSILFNNLPNIKEVNKTELIYYIWKNQEQFFNDLTHDELLKRYKEENKDEIKNIIYKNALNRNMYHLNNKKSIFSNDKLIEVLCTKSFDQNLELIVKEYKSNYLFIHQKIDSFLLELLGNVNLIPINIRYICKIIYLLISAKFPTLPKYLKNAFIGKFFFDKYIYPNLLFENKLLFNNNIMKFQIKKCIGEIISILSFANNCELFDNYNNIEKTVFNNYLLEIIPILDKFYNLIMDVKLPDIIEELINFKIKNIQINKTEKKSFRKKKVENINNIINYKNDLFISDIIKKKKTKRKFNLTSKFKYICFSVRNLLYILSLIDKNKNKFENLPNKDIFNTIFQSLINKKQDIEILNSNNDKTEKFYLIYEKPKNNFIKLFRNTKRQNTNFFLKTKNSLNEMNLKHIKYCLKNILQEINIFDISYINNSDDNIDKKKNEIIPLNWYRKYLKDNIKLLDEKYLKNNKEELFNELYEDELYNINLLNEYWDLLIMKDKDKINAEDNNIKKLKSKLNYMENAYNINLAENIIFVQNIEVYMTLNICNKKNKNENIPPITIELNKENEENEIKIDKIEEFINLFSINSSLISNEQKFELYNLILSEIINGENNSTINQVLLKYLSLIRKHIKENIMNLTKERIKEILYIIKDYIIGAIYKSLFPKQPIEKDIIFYNRTLELDWVSQENFGIKNIELYQINYPENIMNKFERAKTIKEKINYIKLIFKYINNVSKFSTGKEDDLSQDEATPFLQYILIKCQPKRIISNINYIKNFLSEQDLMEEKGFFILQIDSAIEFILSMNHTHLDMNEEEFNENIKNSKIKNKIK